MKYIIFKDFGGQETPIIFPKRIRHEELRRVIPYVQVVSAGHIRLTSSGIECHGGSKALNAESRAKDRELIEDVLREEGK
ncbi:MAG: hypothetical protein ACLFSY_04085 [Desulfonatronovibrionaceae bacterium]